jgi:hypothetical protein
MNALDVVWKDLSDRQKFVIGKIYKGDKYIFKYNQPGIHEASKKGFKGLMAFPDFEKEYTNNILFPAFSMRLPDEKRVDIDEILQKYGLSKYVLLNSLEEMAAVCLLIHWSLSNL